MKIVVLDGFTENPGDLSWDALGELGELTVYDRTAPELVMERMKGAEIVYTNKTVISREAVEASAELKYIGVLATGYNIVDVDAAKDKGIPVTNVPTYSTDAVAQFTIGLLLELCHHIGEHSNCVMRGDWQNSVDFAFWNYPLMELAGKTFGIIGYGKIGRRTAQIAQALGMKVIAFNRSEFDGDGSVAQVGLEELLRSSDVISLHCPLFPETKGMINQESIAKMKDGVMILNTSRGPLIVEEDLREALASGKVAAAAADVVSAEPIKADNPLLQAPNMILTPHIAWAPKEARQRLMDTTVENLRAYLSGSKVNVVNGI